MWREYIHPSSLEVCSSSYSSIETRADDKYPSENDQAGIIFYLLQTKVLPNVSVPSVTSTNA